jgi:transcriptional regulator with XRE-family HTH domain
MQLKLRVGALMKERQLTVNQLAELANIAPNTARALYRGVNERVDLAVLERVAKALGVRPLELFEEVEGERGNRVPSFAVAFSRVPS